MKKNGVRRLLLAAMLLVLVCVLSCGLAEGDDPLTYEVLADGSGVQVTGCNPRAKSVTIPAEHDGLPVVSVADGAFLNCTELEEFRTGEGQGTFYAQDGVLFTDRPVKTLVCFPARNRHLHGSYTVPEGVTVIGPYAFAAQDKLEYLHLPEGVTTLGDCVFAAIRCELCVFVPDSLTEFGEDLLKGQQANVPFFGDWESAAAKYADAHYIPFGGVWDPDKVKDTAGYSAPDLADAEDAPEADPDGTVHWETEVTNRYEPYSIPAGFNLSEKQKSAPAEIRMDLGNRWGALGTEESGYPAQTGVYGIGYTEEPAWIRGYAADGSVTGIRKVEGDFAFSLPGAADIGVAGGKGTFFTAVPYEPAWVSEAGVVSLECGGWDRSAEGEAFRFFAIRFRNATFNFEMPDFLNLMVYNHRDADPENMSYEDFPHCSLITITMRDPVLYHLTDCVGMHVDAMETLLETEELTLQAKQSYHVDAKDYAQKILKVWQEVKEVMQGTYFPQDTEILPVSVVITGEFPTTGNRRIELDEAFVTYDPLNMNTFAHEMVHAVDQTYDNTWWLPSPWMEGRAEYISRKVCDKAGYSSYPYPAECDWSFLGKEDREDFWRFYCESTNRQSTYTVGYYFFDYLCRTWGEDISAKIVKALAEKVKYGVNQNELFREALESVTEKGVFQSFVRDVIEKGK